MPIYSTTPEVAHTATQLTETKHRFYCAHTNQLGQNLPIGDGWSLSCQSVSTACEYFVALDLALLVSKVVF